MKYSYNAHLSWVPERKELVKYMERQEKINKQRNYWIDKARNQLDELFMASLEGDTVKHKSLVDDIATSTIILWRFDRKLDNELLDSR